MKKFVRVFLWMSSGLVLTLAYNNCARFGEMEVAPTGQSLKSLDDADFTFVINENASFTKNQNVELTIENPSADEIYVTNDPTCSAGGSWLPVTPKINWTLGGSNSDVSVSAKFRKSDGSEESECLSDSIVHDNIAPTILFSTKPPAVGSAQNVTFTFTANDSVSGVKSTECSLQNQSAFSSCASPVKYTLGTGNHKVYFKVTDQAGNATVVLQEFEIDQTSPGVEFVSGPAAKTKAKTASFQFSGQNGATSFECRLDSGSYSSCTSPHNTSGTLADGAHIFYVKARNASGSYSSPIQYSWVVDNALPTVSFSTVPPAQNKLAQFIFAFTANDSLTGVSRVECQLDSGTFANCTTLSSHDLKSISVGSHALKVRAVDGAGNVSAVATAQWVRESEVLTLTSPVEWQVIQRNVNNMGAIPINGAFPALAQKLRIKLLKKDNTLIQTQDITRATLKPAANAFAINYSAPAGGWYKLNVSILDQYGIVIGENTLQNVGVGEVFITAGQSNSVRAGQSAQANGALSSFARFDHVNKKMVWRKEMDIAPEAGTPWGPFMTSLSTRLNMPVAVTMVGCGGTRVEQWLPGAEALGAPYCGVTPNIGGLYLRLLDAAGVLKNFRAVIWHQGESDAIANTTTGLYQTRMTRLIDRLNEDTGKNIKWIVANASYIPGVEVDRVVNCNLTGKPLTHLSRMEPIRKAQQNLWAIGKVLRGPNTDDLYGPQYRYSGVGGGCIHFSSNGLRVHGVRWYQAVVNTGIVPLP